MLFIVPGRYFFYDGLDVEYISVLICTVHGVRSPIESAGILKDRVKNTVHRIRNTGSVRV